MKINGKEMDLGNDITVNEVIEKLELSVETVVVEINKEIIPKNEYGSKRVKQDDNVVLVSFVGGG